MAKPRSGKQDEVLLIPFLDILCSLIGILILIIIVVSAAQLQKVKGRTKQDVHLAQQYQKLLLRRKEQEALAAKLRAKVAELEKRRAELAAKERAFDELRVRLTLSADAVQANQKKAAAGQKEIADLLVQIKAIAAALPPLQGEIENLKKLLAERQKKPDDKLTPVIVRPSGSGTRRNQRLFFIEATGAGIVIYKSKTEQIRVAQNSVGVDKEYDAFLTRVRYTRNGALIFLIRKDGWWTYTRAAGWAEQRFGLNTGKLPLPGDGAIDLSLFEKTSLR
jgi:uncharacterized protein YlxW (UPF0749 family)